MTLETFNEVIRTLTDLQAREAFYIEQAKEKGDLGQYMYHLGVSIGYGMAIRQVSALVAGLEVKL
jgi:hypothetical protein